MLSQLGMLLCSTQSYFMCVCGANAVYVMKNYRKPLFGITQKLIVYFDFKLFNLVFGNNMWRPLNRTFKSNFKLIQETVSVRYLPVSLLYLLTHLTDTER